MIDGKDEVNVKKVNLKTSYLAEKHLKNVLF
jgi:hypothetical protein